MYPYEISSSDVTTIFELDSNQFEEQFQLAKPQKDDKIIVISGNRSTNEVYQLRVLGYTKVNYSDGWVNWTVVGSESGRTDRTGILIVCDYLIGISYIIFIVIPCITKDLPILSIPFIACMICTYLYLFNLINFLI